MKRLYYGVASIDIGDTRFNEFGYGLFDSEDEAVGALIRIARKNRPGGRLTNATASVVDDATVRDAARLLAED